MERTAQQQQPQQQTQQQRTDLRTALNSCKPTGYTRLTDLRDNVLYQIRSFERVSTPFGETVMAVLEGFAGDDPLRVYLPRRYLNVLGEQDIAQFNSGVGPRLHLVKRGVAPGTNYAAIEFV